MDIGLYIGTVLWPLLKSSYRIHAFWDCQKLGCSVPGMSVGALPCQAIAASVTAYGRWSVEGWRVWEC